MSGPKCHASGIGGLRKLVCSYSLATAAEVTGSRLQAVPKQQKCKSPPTPDAWPKCHASGFVELLIFLMRVRCLQP
jgi:hypothetical protein